MVRKICVGDINVDWGVYFLFTIFYKRFYFIYTYGYMCMSVWGYVHMKPAEGVGSLSRWSYWKFLTAWCGYWEGNLSPLEEQNTFLTTLSNVCYRHPASLWYSPIIEQSCSFFFKYKIWKGESLIRSGSEMWRQNQYKNTFLFKRHVYLFLWFLFCFFFYW